MNVNYNLDHERPQPKTSASSSMLSPSFFGEYSLKESDQSKTKAVAKETAARKATQEPSHGVVLADGV